MTMRRSSEPYIVEFIQQGRYVKVTAVDPETGTEAVIVGDAKESQDILSDTAVAKLEYMLNRR